MSDIESHIDTVRDGKYMTMIFKVLIGKCQQLMLMSEKTAFFVIHKGK